MHNHGTRKPKRPRPHAGPGAKARWPVSLTTLRELEALVLDCDGVLTKGELLYDELGRRLLSFDARDGVGLAFLCRSGFRVSILSGRPADIAEQRHKELGVLHFVSGCRDKATGLLELCRTMGVAPERCAYVGDDLPDLPALRVAGLAIAVADAAPEVQARAAWVTRAKGGTGAVREVCEVILKARAEWDTLIESLDR